MSSTIEILLATHNGSLFLNELVASLQGQSFTDWRLLISDDCSSDDTLEIARQLVRVDNRICVVSEGIRYGGAKNNFMSLLAHAQAPYVMFCDQDDVWLPEKVELTFSRMCNLEQKHGSMTPALVFTDMAVVDESLELIDSSFERFSGLDPRRLRFGQLLEQNVAAGCTMMLNKSLVDLCCIEGDVSRIRMHDWWVMLVASAFGVVDYIDKPLSLYRQHENNELGAKKYSVTKRPDKSIDRERAFRKRISQAVLFKKLLGRPNRTKDARCLDEYIALDLSKNKYDGAKHFISAACWKKGVRRKAGQVAAMRRLVETNRKAEAALNGVGNHISLNPNNFRILVPCHEACTLPDDPFLMPIQVGASLCDKDLGFQRDDMLRGNQCDNISLKNGSYCELTAVYWAWKNLKAIVPGIEYVGVNHYRRYFAFSRSSMVAEQYSITEESVASYRIDIDYLKKTLENGKAILATRKHRPYSVFSDYTICHNGDDAQVLIEVLHEFYPSFDDAVYKVFFGSNSFSPYNMMILDWKEFECYCEWVFQVLSEVEARIDTSEYDRYQRRVFGFMAERLLNVWVQYRDLKVDHVPIYYVGEAKQPASARRLIGIARRKCVFLARRAKKSTYCFLFKQRASKSCGNSV